MEAFLCAAVGTVVNSAVGKAAEYTVDPIRQQLGYLINYKSKFQNLKDQRQELKDATERVKASVNEAKRQGDEIFNHVDGWLSEVECKMSDEVATHLEEDEKEAQRRCLVGLCPNLKSRFRLSKKAEEESKAIAKLLQRAKEFKTVSSHPNPEGMATRPIKDCQDFESRQVAFDEVMAALRDSNVSIFGVCGMGGVGKTTLVKQVASQAKQENIFDKVIMAAVTQTFEIKKIQDQLADELGLKFDEQSESGRAGRLLQRLKTEKKVLVILDDIWVTLDLEAIGIPCFGAGHEGCKILMTSRELNVLSSMGSQKNIPIKTLNEEEAWDLFKKMTGDIALRPDLHSTALEVAKKCGGLPVAIVTVGRAMRNKEHLFEWENALEDLRRPSQRNFKGIPAYAYSAIELSFKNLEDEEHQLTFLLCSIMGHNAAIEDLLKYGMGLGIFQGIHNVKKTRARVLTLVSNLKNSSLLLDCSEPDCFDMHDVVCDVAISIASRDRGWFTLGTDDEFDEWSDEETMKDCSLISLQDVSEVVDHELQCPNLTFFSMGRDKNISRYDSPQNIPNNFFKGLPKLKVLNLFNMQLVSLPISIDSLTTLRTLRLSGCSLEDITIIGKLKNLEILELHESVVKMLPGEIGELSKLKFLNLSFCYRLKIISPNVLSCFSKLEELYLNDSFCEWEIDEGRDDKPRSNASLVELQSLSNLTTLVAHIPQKQAISKDITFFGKLERYTISIGRSRWNRYEKFGTTRNLRLDLKPGIDLHDGVKTLVKKADNLCLDREGAEDVTLSLFMDLQREGFHGLKHFTISEVSKIKYLINPMNIEVFPVLESLTLIMLKDLETMCYGQLKARCFSQLRVITVKGCNTLKNLFSFSIVKELHQLKEIVIAGCENITSLIEEKRQEEIGNEEVTDVLKFSRLESLSLVKLPRLRAICCSKSKISSPFNQKVLFPELKELILYSVAVEKLWDDHQYQVMPLTTLHIECCHNLKYVFSSSMVKSFVRLKTLRVELCRDIEVIVLKEGSSMDRTSTVVFPELRQLKLKYLSKLKSFYSVSSGCDEASSSNSISIENLPTHEDRYLFDKKSMFPNLEELTLDGHSNGIKDISHVGDAQLLASQHFRKLKVVRLESSFEELLPALSQFLMSLPDLEWLNIDPVLPFALKPSDGLKLGNNILVPSSVSFQNLVTLVVSDCHKIKKLITPSTAKTLVQLQKMIISSCLNLKEIMQGGDSEDGEVKDENETICFPQLKELTLSSLREFKSFCSSENYKFQLPSLTTIILSRCPRMEMFSQGDSYTSSLCKVEFFDSIHNRVVKELSSGSLNNTISSFYLANLRVP
ncbi:Disease resistance protein [Corchorus olitorius]|uniref:Disease resistance protein n=1 Tax=Corchorus olitorius TaxID=93759 RepID=A0A1R3K8B4_9ROSI|nr:Disease resistance protein [Corchorus olitorius]